MDDFPPERPNVWASPPPRPSHELPSASERPSPRPSPDPKIVAPIAFVIGLIVTVLGALALPTALDVSAERGAHGVYVIADESTCEQDRCRTHRGTFTSDDGRIVRSGVGLVGSPLKSVTQSGRVRAFDIGDSSVVYLEGAGAPPVLPWLFGVGGVGAMVFGLVHMMREWRKRRRTRRDQAPGPSAGHG